MTTYAQVRAGAIVRVGLPAVGRLSDGREVSNYDQLDAATLAAEGWLPVTEDRPDYDPATQQLTLDHYEIGDTAVTGVYVVGPIPAPPTAPPTADQFAALQSAVATLTMQVLTGGA